MYLFPILLLFSIIINHGTFATIMKSLHNGPKFYNNEITADLKDSNNFYLISINGGVTPSPQCWRTAISIFKVNDDVEWDNIGNICAALPEMSMNKLALEISQCHLNRVGKSLYKQIKGDNNTITRDDCMKPYIEPNTISVCLQHLTPIGLTTFTTFITFVQNICLRLTQEMILENQKQVLYETSATHAELVIQTIHALKSSEQMSKNHLDSLIAMEMIPDRMTHQLSVVLPQIINETVKNSLEKVVEHQLNVQLQEILPRILPMLLQHHADEQYQGLHDRFELREIQHRQKDEDSTKERNRVTEEQIREIKEMKESFSTTLQHIKPLVSLHILYHSVTNGYVMFAQYRYYIVTFIMIWIFTYPKQNSPLRSFLYGIFFTEIFFEILISFVSINYNTMINESDRKWYIDELRTHTTLIECVVVVAGIILLRLSNIVKGKRRHRDSNIKSMPTQSQSVPEQEVLYVNQHYNNRNKNNNIRDNYRSVRADNAYEYTSKPMRSSDDVPRNEHHNLPFKRNDIFVPPTYDQMLIEYLKLKETETTVTNESRIMYPSLQHQPDTFPEVFSHNQPYYQPSNSSLSHVHHSRTTESPLSFDLSEDIFYDPMIVEESSSSIGSNEEMVVVDSENNSTTLKKSVNNKKRSKKMTDVTCHINKKQKRNDASSR